MDIGNQIKALRLRRGVTQEAMAQHFGITPQAVSKWECGTSVPDIGLLPELSAYFGVSIDELFALSDEVRIERIQRMLWNQRFLNPADAKHESEFLLEKARREPDNGDPHCMLAQLELHQAKEHRIRAEEYALEILKRTNGGFGCLYLAPAMGGKRSEPRHNTHNALISILEEWVQIAPREQELYEYLITQLLDDHRVTKAKHYCDQMARNCSGWPVTVQQIRVMLAKYEIANARRMWQQLLAENPENWEIHYWVGNFQTQLEEYADAKESYRTAISLLPFPRYAEPIDALAQVCEMDGDIPGAMAARQLDLEISQTEWGYTAGEVLDSVLREIRRLEDLL